MTNIESWDRLAARAARVSPATDTVWFGPDGPTDRDIRVLGDYRGKRVLDLGCGRGQAAIAFAKGGATTIALDASSGMVAAARQTAALTETRVEWHIGDLADLAFLRADSIDLVFSAFAFEEVEDLGRALRQIHRVLRVNASLVFSITHPFARITQRDGDDTLLPASPTVTRSYNGGQPMMIDVDGEPIRVWPRTISEIFTTLARAGFRTDIFLEPTPTPTPGTVAIPELLVWRARKEGS